MRYFEWLYSAIAERLRFKRFLLVVLQRCQSTECQLRILSHFWMKTTSRNRSLRRTLLTLRLNQLRPLVLHRKARVSNPDSTRVRLGDRRGRGRGRGGRRGEGGGPRAHVVGCFLLFK